MTEKGYKIYVLGISDEDWNKVVVPFSMGKYSQIDRSYVTKYFPIFNSNGSRSVLRMILDKNPYIINNHWKKKGLDIPLDQEVWSRPEIEEESVEFLE